LNAILEKKIPMVGKMYCVDGENIIEIAVHNFEKKNIKVFREKG